MLFIRDKKSYLLLLPLYFGLALFVVGCATYQSSQRLKNEIIEGSHKGYYIPSVPFLKQKGDWCGPASLASVLNYWGKNVSQEEIAEGIYLSSIHGTLTFDLVRYPTMLGLWASSYKGNSTDLKEKVSRNLPIIVLQKVAPPFPIYHYLVVIGYDETHKLIIAHSGRREGLLIPYRRFMRSWAEADCWTLVICPPERIYWELTAPEYNTLGMLYEEQGKLELAIESYQKSLQLEPTNAETRFNLGNAYLGEKRFSEAIASYKEALKVNPSFADAYNNLAWVYIQMDFDLDKAQQCIERALNLNPDREPYYLDTLGELFYHQGSYEDAIAAFDKSLDAAPPHFPPQSQALVYYHLGLAYLANNQREEAVQSFQEAIKINPQGEVTDEIRQILNSEIH